MDKKDYPGIFSRVKAVIVDSVVIVVVLMAMTDVFSNIEGNVPNYFKMLAFTFIFFLYEPLMLSIFGATVGHRINGLKVQQINNGKKINFLVAIVRFILKTTLGWVSLITISKSEYNQAIHDKKTKSIVVYND